jgi:alpha-L-fucosidase
VIAALQHGDPGGAVWRPAETDTSIRPGWFHHVTEDERVKPVDQLVGIWLTSVGRNSKLLLNVPPTRDGVLHATDVARLAELRAHVTSLFAEDLAAGRPVAWRVTRGPTAVAEVDLGRTVPIAVARLEEDIARGQCVARYAVHGTVAGGGDWRELARGTTVGYRKVDRFEPAALRKVRVVVEDAAATPRPLRIGLYP